ncbi:MAG: hypothetical protein QNJ46_04220 [Leptolyngbyaceae cyanobacterium MO_188.B28]|nr:hypothetical protein [Leptolyngbyaceae cyanobacterium MO_188.B28]
MTSTLPDIWERTNPLLILRRITRSLPHPTHHHHSSQTPFGVSGILFQGDRFGWWWSKEIAHGQPIQVLKATLLSEWHCAIAFSKHRGECNREWHKWVRSPPNLK